jgi:hypothetical protein
LPLLAAGYAKRSAEKQMIEIESESEQLDLQWHGPFLWPGVTAMGGFERLENSWVAGESGIYLWTVPYDRGYLIYAAGQTKRPVMTRLKEHSNAHRNGFFTIFDMDELERGHRVEIWHGSFGKKLTPERRRDFNERREEIRRAAQEQIGRFRVFVGPVRPDRRLLARMEAGVMDSLYAAPAPFSEVPDRGMSLSRRSRSEPPIRVNNRNAGELHALPESMSV